MRTRIALVAIAPIAVITASTLVQAASVQSTGAEPTQSSGASSSPVSPLPPNHLIAYRGLTVAGQPQEASKLLLNLGSVLLHDPDLAQPATPAPTPVPAAAPAVTASTDTVTPAQRAAWERVALCEEGGSWTADGGRFSGGLGISRANWAAYGGTQYAAIGAAATEDQQIMVAERIQSSPPDQYGCHGW